MLCKVIVAYTDRITDEVHMSGEEVELTDARAAELSEGGFVEMPAKTVKKTAAKRTRKTTAKAGKEGA